MPTRPTSAARNLEPGLIQAYADEAAAGVRATGGDLAQYALARGLVDALKTRQQFEEIVARVAGEDEETGYAAVDWDGTCPTCADRALQARRQVGRIVVASGEILDGERAPGLVGGDSLAKLLRDAREDDDVAAVVLRIDSPGGSIMASEVIRREIAALKAAGKPVVASMSTVAASGGYYIAMDADRIYAAPTTITGSIGVFAVMPTSSARSTRSASRTTGSGPRGCPGSPTSTASSARMRRKSCRRRSSTTIALRRGRPPGAQAPAEEIEPRAGARVDGGGREAAGIVDELGGVDDAIAKAARLADLDEDEYACAGWSRSGPGATRWRGSCGRGGRPGGRRRTAPPRPAAGRSRARARAPARARRRAAGLPLLLPEWTGQARLAAQSRMTLPDWPPPMVSKARA